MEFTHLFHVEMPVPVITLLQDLELRGCTYRVDPTLASFWVTPVSLVTDDERALLRRYKPHLLHFLCHCDLPTTPTSVFT